MKNKKKLKSISSKVIANVAKMQDSPNEKGREVHRRNLLINILAEFGFTNLLNDVGQEKKRPDLRYFSNDIEKPNNSTAAPFIVETKDIGEIELFENLPFQQLCMYIVKNYKRIVSLAVTDYEWWYRFDFDSNHQAYFSLLNFAKAVDGDVKAWKKHGGNETAAKLFEPFLIGAPLQFSNFAKKSGAGSFLATVLNQFDTSILERSAPIVEYVVTNETLNVETVAVELGTLMSPLVSIAVDLISNEIDNLPRAKSRFKMWIKQQGDLTLTLDRILSKDRDLEEEKVYEEKTAQFAWLASYSLLNILYFVRGLEERQLISPIVNSDAVKKNPALFFNNLWQETDSGALSHFTDFIRLQKVYCDWLIPKLPQGKLGELVRFVSTTAGLSDNQPDLLGNLYEKLMQNLDTTSRRKLGQYYTPKPIAELLWKIAREGLSTAGVSAEDVTTLDPGCGSGMLLCRGVDLLVSEINPEPSALCSTIRDLASRNMNGFEINPLSSAIARINLFFTYIDQIKKRGGDPVSQFVKKVSISEIPIFNTDAYKISESVSHELSTLADLEGEDIEALKREALFLKRTKDRSDFILMIGNPPYSGSDESVSEGRADHLKVWNNQFAKRKPNSGIREAYLHFMGLAHTVLTKGGRGMVAFVTSDSWLSNHDHEVARRFFFKNYESNGIVFMGPGMFPGLKVSTCLIVMQLREEPLSDSEVEKVALPVFSLPVEDSPEVRYKVIDKILSGKQKIQWKKVKPDEYCCIRDFGKSDLEFGSEFQKITNYFHMEFQACETGFDSFLTATDLPQLKKRMKDIIGSDSIVEPDKNIPGKNNKNKLAKLRKIRDKENLEYKTNAYRTFLKYSGSKDKFGVPQSRKHFVYYEPKMLHRAVTISRTINENEKTWIPHESELKLVFNSHEVPLKSFVVTDSSYVHRWGHLRFCPPTVPAWVIDKKSSSDNHISNLTVLGSENAKAIGSVENLYFFISGWINSEVMSMGFKSRARGQEAVIPNLAIASKKVIDCASKVSALTKALTQIETESLERNDLLEKRTTLVLSEICGYKGSLKAEEAYSVGLKKLNELCAEIYQDMSQSKKKAS